MASINTSGGIHFPAETAPPPAAGGDKNNPPAAPGASRDVKTSTAQARRAAETTRMLIHPGTDPLSQEGPPPQAVVSVSDQGIAVVGGRLHAWRAQDRAWTPTGAAGIASVKLGANNDQVWALNAHGDLARVGHDGALQAAQFRLPAGVVDFAVSPTARAVTYITAAALMRDAGDAPARSLALPAALGGAPATLAQANNGDLYVASRAGDVWMLPAAPAQTAASWTRVGAPDASSAPRQMSKLHIMRSGHLGGEDQRRRLCRYDRASNTWSETTPLSGSDHRQAFERLPAGSGWANIGLNAAPVKFFSMGLPASTADVAGHGDLAGLETTLRGAMGQLGLAALNDTPPISGLLAEPRSVINAMVDTADVAADKVLTALEDNIGKLPTSTDSSKRNSPDHNVLQAVYNFRSRVLGRSRSTTQPDPVLQRLAVLLRKNVYLPVNDPSSMIAAGKLLVDHAMIKQAVDARKAAAPPRPGARPPAPLVAADDADTITALFNAGMVDRAQFQRTNAASSSLNAGMTKMNAGMKNTLAPVAGEDAAAIGAQFADLVANLRPGKESIALTFSHSKGFDLEGLWMFFNINSDTVGKAGANVLSANKLPILTPLGTGMHGGTLSLETSRTETGVQVVLSDASESSGSVGARAQLRFGGVWEKANGNVTLLAVAGAEAAVIPAFAVGNKRSVAMQFNQDDAGKVQQVIADLYSGEVSLTNLLKRADMVTNAQGDSFSVGADGHVHVFAALRANYGKQRPDLPPNTLLAASNLIVPALDQVAGSVRYGSASEVSRAQDGTQQRTSKQGVTGSADFNHISVVDVSTWFSIPFGKDGSTQIQWKVPALLSVLNHNLWTNKLDTQDATVRLAADGSLAGASVTVATREATVRTAAADRPLTADLFPQLPALLADQPGMRPFVKLLNDHPERRPAVTLELTPAATASVQRDIAALAQSGAQGEQAKAAVVKLVGAALQNQDNLHIARVDVGAARTIPQQAIQAFGPVRAVRSQSHTFAEAGSSIVVDHDPASGAATGFHVEGKALLGNAVQPNLSALVDMH